MSQSTIAKCYLAVRRMVDRDLANRRSISPFLAMFPIAIARWTVDHVVTRGHAAIWVIAGALCVSWLGFIGWRGVTLFMHFIARGDRAYDESGKLALPPEYRDTESASRTRARRLLRPTIRPRE